MYSSGEIYQLPLENDQKTFHLLVGSFSLPDYLTYMNHFYKIKNRNEVNQEAA
jgi:uncharacterized short protein YbdD (DUF466 family)